MAWPKGVKRGHRHAKLPKKYRAVKKTASVQVTAKVVLPRGLDELQNIVNSLVDAHCAVFVEPQNSANYELLRAESVLAGARFEHWLAKARRGEW